MKTSRLISGILTIFILLPISFYLQFWVISQLHADRLIWFLFWTYIPLTIFVTVVIKFIEDSE